MAIHPESKRVKLTILSEWGMVLFSPLTVTETLPNHSHLKTHVGIRGHFDVIAGFRYL